MQSITDTLNEIRAESHIIFYYKMVQSEDCIFLASVGLVLWCLMPLSTIYHNGVRVMVFNVTFYNISQWG